MILQVAEQLLLSLGALEAKPGSNSKVKGKKGQRSLQYIISTEMKQNEFCCNSIFTVCVGSDEKDTELSNSVFTYIFINLSRFHCFHNFVDFGLF